jgi:hypothetical protein
MAEQISMLGIRIEEMEARHELAVEPDESNRRFIQANPKVPRGIREERMSCACKGHQEGAGTFDRLAGACLHESELHRFCSSGANEARPICLGLGGLPRIR